MNSEQLYVTLQAASSSDAAVRRPAGEALAQLQQQAGYATALLALAGERRIEPPHRLLCAGAPAVVRGADDAASSHVLRLVALCVCACRCVRAARCHRLLGARNRSSASATVAPRFDAVALAARCAGRTRCDDVGRGRFRFGAAQMCAFAVMQRGVSLSRDCGDVSVCDSVVAAARRANQRRSASRVQERSQAPLAQRRAQAGVWSARRRDAAAHRPRVGASTRRCRPPVARSRVRR